MSSRGPGRTGEAVSQRARRTFLLLLARHEATSHRYLTSLSFATWGGRYRGFEDLRHPEVPAVSVARVTLSLAGLLGDFTGCNFPIERSCRVERALTKAVSIGSDTGQRSFPHGSRRRKQSAFRAFHSRFGRLGRTAASRHRDVERFPFRVSQARCPKNFFASLKRTFRATQPRNI